MSLPQGFSVYQPFIGAPLQFLPALGTKELDNLLDAYVPGTASLKEKRADVSVDFFEHMQTTGQSFKFYAIPGLYATGASSMPESPATTASFHASASTPSVNASPVTSNWDWSFVNSGIQTPAEMASASSRPSNLQQTVSHRNSKSASPASRQASPIDFSHLPGMKILTKDGTDVTNSASRGCKTKEQRDHAHLMRIIKACESCRKKKIRCDPSHKRGPSARQSSNKIAKKAVRAAASAASMSPLVTTPSTAPETVSAEPMFQEESPDMALALDSTFDSNLDFSDLMSGFEPFDIATAAPAAESWEDFIKYPPATGIDSGLDFSFSYGVSSAIQDQQFSASSISSGSPFASSEDQASSSHSVSSGSSPEATVSTQTQPVAASFSTVPEESVNGSLAPQASTFSFSPSSPGRNRHTSAGENDINRRSGANRSADGDIGSDEHMSLFSSPATHSASPVASPVLAASQDSQEVSQHRRETSSDLVSTQLQTGASTSSSDTPAQPLLQERIRERVSSPADDPTAGPSGLDDSRTPQGTALGSTQPPVVFSVPPRRPRQGERLVIDATSVARNSNSSTPAEQHSTAASNSNLATVGLSLEGSNLGQYATQAQLLLSSLAVNTLAAIVAVATAGPTPMVIQAQRLETTSKQGRQGKGANNWRHRSSVDSMPLGASMTPLVSAC